MVSPRKRSVGTVLDYPSTFFANTTVTTFNTYSSRSTWRWVPLTGPILVTNPKELDGRHLWLWLRSYTVVKNLPNRSMDLRPTNVTWQKFDVSFRYKKEWLYLWMKLILNRNQSMLRRRFLMSNTWTPYEMGCSTIKWVVIKSSSLYEMSLKLSRYPVSYKYFKSL